MAVQDGWKYIKGRTQDGSLRGTYTAEDLVLQLLTGVPLDKSLAGIPLHSAGRAMRHTPTFKMRKVNPKRHYNTLKMQAPFYYVEKDALCKPLYASAFKRGDDIPTFKRRDDIPTFKRGDDIPFSFTFVVENKSFSFVSLV
jgi:hypothetical protein